MHVTGGFSPLSEAPKASSWTYATHATHIFVVLTGNQNEHHHFWGSPILKHTHTSNLFIARLEGPACASPIQAGPSDRNSTKSRQEAQYIRAMILLCALSKIRCML